MKLRRKELLQKMIMAFDKAVLKNLISDLLEQACDL